MLKPHTLKSMKPTAVCLLLPVLSFLPGCLQVSTEPIEIKPIHITVDVNVRVEKALDDFFGNLDSKSATLSLD
jgi:hypothetical protein